jgi:hypothetical protein
MTIPAIGNGRLPKCGGIKWQRVESLQPFSSFDLARIFHPFRREALVTNIAELSPFVARHVRFTTAVVFFTR